MDDIAPRTSILTPTRHTSAVGQCTDIVINLMSFDEFCQEFEASSNKERSIMFGRLMALTTHLHI